MIYLISSMLIILNDNFVYVCGKHNNSCWHVCVCIYILYYTYIQKNSRGLYGCVYNVKHNYCLHIFSVFIWLYLFIVHYGVFMCLLLAVCRGGMWQEYIKSSKKERKCCISRNTQTTCFWSIPEVFCDVCIKKHVSQCS